MGVPKRAEDGQRDELPQVRNEEVQADLNTIGGRGVGNGEGDQPNFSRGGGGGVGVGPTGGGTSYAFLRGERGE